MALILQEVSGEPEIAIPDPVRDAYALWRPTPLYRARRLEQELGTPAKIFYKYEGVSPAGSHKPNTAVPQAYENAQAGSRSSSTETGAGQWGSSLAFACALFGLECEVFMVGSSYDQKPYRRSMMQTWGATVHRSPSDRTQSGRRQARTRPARSGSRSPRPSRSRARTRTATTRSARAQPRAAAPDRDRPGGDRAARDGAGVPGRDRRLRRRRLELRRADVPVHARDAARREPIRYVAAEPAACPTLTRGVYAYDFGDTAGLTPLMPMYTLGHDFVPPPVHAGGLRYHGDAPMLCGLVKAGAVEARAYRRTRRSRRPCGSRAPRGSSRRPSPRTRSAR
jgi:tryptophan synthase beta chain